MCFFVMLAKLILFTCVLLQQGSDGDLIVIGGGYLNVTGLTPNVSFIKTTFLFSSEINILYRVYQRPYNVTLKQTIKVVTGNTTINSTNRCIAFGESFDMWGQIPIQYPEETGNGGCDALWGRECSQNILTKIRESSFDDIKDVYCGIPIPDILSKPPPGCRADNISRGGIGMVEFLRNGTFMLNQSSTIMDASKPWLYFESTPTVDGNYHELMKNFVFTYFVGREYTSSKVDAAISCMSVFNKNNTPSGIKVMRSGCFLIVSSLMIIFFGIYV